MTLSRLAILGPLLCTLLLTQRAQAGPVEQLVQVAAHPTDPDVFAMRYQYGGEGVFITRDAGESFSLLCNSAIDPALTRGGPLGFAGDGTLFMGVFQGLFQDDASGCAWSKDSMFDGQWVSDITGDPLDPDALYLVTSSGNDGSDNGLYRRDASGSWSQVGALEFVLISRVHVVDLGGGDTRIYQSILDGTIDGDETINDMPVQVPNYLMRHSEDGANTWTSFPLGVVEGTFRLQGVDPTNPDRLIGTLDRGDDGTTVIVSEDRGESWSDYLVLTGFGGIAFAPDGRVWIADTGATTDPSAPMGIHTAANLGESPTVLTADYPVGCLRYIDDDTLFACQRFSGGRVSTADGTMVESFKFTEVESFVSCDGVDMLATCEMQLLGAYCGITHFPLAPVCAPYEVDLSELSDGSGCAFDFDAGIGTGTLPDGGCIEPADPGSTPPDTPTTTDPADAGVPGDGGATPSGPAGESDGDGDSDGGDDDGGCLTVAPGAQSGAPGALAGLLAAAVGLLAVRRRRRK